MWQVQQNRIEFIDHIWTVADNEDDVEQSNNAATSSSSHHHQQQKPSRGESRQQIDTGGDLTGQSGGEGAGEHGPRR